MPQSYGEWRGNVYRPSEHDAFFETPEWKPTRRRILRRNNYRCLRCDQRFPAAEMSAHHLIPRSEGGANGIENLVALCNKCHDYVEIHNLRNRSDIMGSIESVTYEVLDLTDYSEGTDDYHKEWWHKYVYGGCRRRR